MEERKRFSLILLGSLAKSENLTAQNRLAGEKDTNLFNINFMWHDSLHKEMKIKKKKTNEKKPRTESIYARFDEEYAVA